MLSSTRSQWLRHRWSVTFAILLAGSLAAASALGATSLAPVLDNTLFPPPACCGSTVWPRVGARALPPPPAGRARRPRPGTRPGSTASIPGRHASPGVRSRGQSPIRRCVETGWHSIALRGLPGRLARVGCRAFPLVSARSSRRSCCSGRSPAFRLPPRAHPGLSRSIGWNPSTSSSETRRFRYATVHSPTHSYRTNLEVHVARLHCPAPPGAPKLRPTPILCRVPGDCLPILRASTTG